MSRSLKTRMRSARRSRSSATEVVEGTGRARVAGRLRPGNDVRSTLIVVGAMMRTRAGRSSMMLLG